MDFNQGAITTIHQYDTISPEKFAARIRPLTQERPAALVLPVLARDLHSPTFEAIASELQHVDYLSEVVVALTTERPEDIDVALRKLRNVPADTRVLWCERPEIRRILGEVADRELEIPSLTGKGFAVWLGAGVAMLDNYALCFHDADTQSYDRTLPGRMLFPIVSPELDYNYSKAYYARISENRFYGRAARLFVWPFLDALAVLFEGSEFIRYLRTFRYPLSGEFASTSDLFSNVRVPTDWGLEGGLLAEVYRNASRKRICQVDLGFYSHKHRPVGSTPQEGLRRMVRDFATTIFRSITESEGAVLSEARMLTLRVLYRRHAQDYVRKYHADAVMNGLEYDRHEEETSIEQFMGSIEEAGKLYFEDPRRNQMPDWARSTSARPTLPKDLLDLTYGRDSVMQEIKETAREA